MGVFSRNRSYLAGFDSSEIIANENYVGGVGAMQMVIEGYQNDHALFEAVLGMDFQEVAALNEGVELEIFTEASVSSLFDKIKEFVKKAWEKIKGLFKTFLTKLNNVIMRDNKAFVDKYRRTVTTKDLSKMKYKWREEIDKNLEHKSISYIESAVFGKLTEIKELTTASEIDKKQDEIEDPDYLDKVLTLLLNETTDSKSFANDMMSAFFEEEEKEEGLNSTRLMNIISVLSDKKLITNLERCKKEIDRYFVKLLKTLDNISTSIFKDIQSDSNNTGLKLSRLYKEASNRKAKEDNTNINNTNTDTTTSDDKITNDIDLSYNDKDSRELTFRKVNLMQRAVSIYQTALNMYIGRFIECAKFNIKQCRRVFAQAASFNPKAVRENAILIEAVGEAAEYELHSLMESAEY